MQIRDYIDALPDSYEKRQSGNNYKLLSLEQTVVQALREDVEAVQKTLDVYTATGATLDLYGAIYGKARGTATDEQFRYIIVQAANRCLVSGDANSIINSLAVTFGVPASSFSIHETDTPCEVEVTGFPYEILQRAGITTEQMMKIIQGMLPSGVKLRPIELAGTFEFGGVSYDYDEDAGFGNEEQTVGGYFGYLIS